MWLPIYRIELGGLTAYTVIQARPPPEWQVGTYKKVSRVKPSQDPKLSKVFRPSKCET